MSARIHRCWRKWEDGSLFDSRASTYLNTWMCFDCSSNYRTSISPSLFLSMEKWGEMPPNPSKEQEGRPKKYSPADQTSICICIEEECGWMPKDSYSASKTAFYQGWCQLYQEEGVLGDLFDPQKPGLGVQLFDLYVMSEMPPLSGSTHNVTVVASYLLPWVIYYVGIFLIQFSSLSYLDSRAT